ncbi:hypothetical protein EF919_31575, partial [Streptomyces sp. WAC02707]
MRRRTTAPAGGPVAARPGPQDAAESANGVIPGAGPVGPVAPLPTDPPGGGEIGLTIPAVALASVWLSGPLVLGLSSIHMVLLALTVVVASLTV